MKVVFKIVFLISVIFIGLWIVFPIVREIFDLEFTSDSIKSTYKEFVFYAVPVAILLTLFGTIKSIDKGTTIIAKAVITIVITCGILFFMFISIFGDMCVWTNRKVLFENKNDSTTKIIVRDFGCGATDSGLPLVGIYEVQNFTRYFIRSTKIDTAELNKKEWIRIE